MEEIFSLVLQREGVDLRCYRRTTIARRMVHRLQKTGCRDLQQYLELLVEDPEESLRLVQYVTIKVGHFFRSPELFHLLHREVLPDLLRSIPPEGLHIWSAGCGNGEEVYSLAILLEELEGEENPARATVLGTDLDGEALALAARGTFPKESLKEMPEALIGRYFTELPDRFGARYEVRPFLRRRVCFHRHDLLSGRPPWEGAQPRLILCRNVQIYLERFAQERLLDLLSTSLQPGGYLCLGEAEQLPPSRSVSFETVHRRLKLYRRR